MGILVTTQQTQFTHQEFVSSLVQNWRYLYREIPKKESVAVLFAQVGNETAFKAVYNFNLGNVKYVEKDKNDGVKYMMLKNVWEIINGQKVIFQPPHPATWFVAFDNLEDGMTFYLQKLKTRFKSAWVAVESGDPAQFASLLKKAKYYTAPEADYIKNMNYYFNIYMKNDWYENAVKNSSTARDTGKMLIDKFSELI